MLIERDMSEFSWPREDLPPELGFGLMTHDLPAVREPALGLQLIEVQATEQTVRRGPPG